MGGGRLPFGRSGSLTVCHRLIKKSSAAAALSAVGTLFGAAVPPFTRAERRDAVAYVMRDYH